MVDQHVDVCVVGAGVGGIACAQGLVRQGASVLLLERLHPMPDCLKAEKIGGEAVQALLRLGFAAAVAAALTPLHDVAVFFAERHLGTLRLDPPEAGLHYHTLVNQLRAQLDPRVDFRPGLKAVAVDQRPEGVEVVTDSGQRIGCRLVILATGDARHLLETLGATYESHLPHQVFAVAATLEGTLGDPARPVDSQTYHHPLADGPLAYATFFRLGTAIRANIFCQGPSADHWQHDLKQQPLAVLAVQNRRLAAAAQAWRVVSPVMTRKVQVARWHLPARPRMVMLGDAAHTIDPAGAGGLTLLLTEVELLLNCYLPRWLQGEAGHSAAIQAFYDDPRRGGAMQQFFGGGRYIFALNHDSSPRGTGRRLYFMLRQTVAGLGRRSARSRPPADRPWQLPAPYLYERYHPTNRA